MTHDFATTSRSESNVNDIPTPSSPFGLKKVVALSVAAILSLILALALWLFTDNAAEVVAPVDPVVTSPVEASSQPPAEPIDKTSETVTEATVEEDTGYEFYDNLKDNKWRIPVQKGRYVDPNDALSREKAVFKLQAASFTNAKDADRLVVKLKRLGFKARTVSSVSASGQSWYQVSVGPFTNVSQLNKAHDILVSMSMMPIKRRVH